MTYLGSFFYLYYLLNWVQEQHHTFFRTGLQYNPELFETNFIPHLSLIVQQSIITKSGIHIQII